MIVGGTTEVFFLLLSSKQEFARPALPVGVYQASINKHLGNSSFVGFIKKDS